MLVVYDDFYTEHLRRFAHPESPERVSGVADYLHERGFLGGRIAARDATSEELTLVHTRAYLDGVQRDVESAGSGARYLDTGDTLVDASSFAVARRAAGGALVAAEQTAHRAEPVFALVRPPGHHAEPARGMGFCLFNNAALAARSFVQAGGGPALIVDFDYHHGNGSQAEAGAGVSFVSTHAYPQYPGTGSFQSSVLDSGGAIVNVPLPADGYSTEAFVATWQELLPLVAQRTQPSLLVVSAGYDFAAGDPVGDLGIDGPLAARALAELIRETAARHTGGRIAYVLEGGYDVRVLCECIAQTLEVHDAPAREQTRGERGAIPLPQRAMLEKLAAWDF